MKKTLLLVVLGFVLLLGACAIDVDPVRYTVSFETNGGTLIDDQMVELEHAAVEPRYPTKEGFTFEGWYSDIELTLGYDFSLEINDDQTIYAKWEEVVVLTDLAKLDEALDALLLVDETSSNLVLPLIGLHDVTITWESSKENIITNDGIVTLPSYSEGDTEVIFTAHLTLGDDTLTKVFTVTVLATTVLTDIEKLIEARDTLAMVPTATEDIILPLIGMYDTVITWESSKTYILENDGTITRPLFTEGNTTVILTAFLTLGDETITKVFEVVVLAATEMTDSERVEIATNALFLNHPDLVVDDITLPTLFTGDDFTATITWESFNIAIISNEGVVTRPAIGEANIIVVLTATITVGDETSTKDFNITVKANEPDYLLQTIIEIHELNLDDNLEFQGIVIATFELGYIMTDGVNTIGVYSPAYEGSISVGDEVLVKGHYTIYHSLYQIYASLSEEVISTGNPVVLIPTVITVEDLLALDSTNKLIHGVPYTITGTVEIRGEYDRIYIVDGDSAVLISFFSIDSSLELLEAKVGEIVTITVNYYVNHVNDGVVVIFDGLAEDIVVTIPDDTPLFTVDELEMLASLASLFSITPDPIEVTILGESVLPIVGVSTLTGYRNMEDEEVINSLFMNTVTAPEYYEIVGMYNDSLSDMHSYLAIILPIVATFTEFETTYEVGGFTFIVHRLSDNEYQILVTGQVYSQDISLEIVIENISLFEEYMYYIEFTTPIASWHYEINRDIFGINSILEIKELLGDDLGVVYLNQFVFDGDTISGFIFKDEITITRRMYFEFTDVSNSIYYLNDDTGTEKYISLDLNGNLVFEYEDYMPGVPLVGSTKARWALDQLGGYSTIEFIEGLIFNDYLIDGTTTIDETDAFSIQAKDYIIVTYDDVAEIFEEEVLANWFYRIDGTWADDKASLFTLESFFTTLYTYNVEQTLDILDVNKDLETVFEISILTVTKQDVLDYLNN